MAIVPFGLSILSEVDGLAEGERQASFVARIDPPPSPVVRTPLGLVLALDVSGSMAGEKLACAVGSAEAIVRSLSARDTFACVTFHSKVAVLVPPTIMPEAGKTSAIEKLRRAQAMGNTNLADAVLRALDVADTMSGGGRVLFLTDGCPTEGVVDPAQILHLARGSLRGATLSTFGFGRDVNPVLLRSLSDTGRGTYAFIEQGEPPLAAIAAELGGLVSTVGAGVTVDILPGPHVTLERVHRIGGLSFGKNGEAHLELPPLLAEEAVHIGFRLSFTDAAVGKPFALVVLRARRTDDGSPVILETRVEARFRPQRGALVREAAKELLLARAAIVLHNTSVAAATRARDLVEELAGYHGELTGEARAANVSDDPQVQAVLQMIDEARRELRAGARVDDMRHDLVAAAASVRGKRSTRLTAMSHGTFVSKSQRVGWDLVQGAAPPPPMKPR